jgi:hypothetical protein
MSDRQPESEERPSGEPTMVGFIWSEREIGPDTRRLPGDLFCVRDGFCALFGWRPGSDEWSRFIEAPHPDDMDRLIDHLGLAQFDHEYGPHWELLRTLLDHPGISFYNLHSIQSAHCMYQPHLRHHLSLPPQFAPFQPELFRVVVDARQPPGPRSWCAIEGCPGI